ncbi:MAG TPA: apolipoprotein N-acyltransferase [Terriglobales bacterium]|nr:apolipoprotein N-acyltransferase [Terriglobales bacterium]
MGKIHQNAWILVFISAVLQILIFPLPNLYFLGWIAVAPLLIALLRARRPNTLQFTEGVKLLPATPLQAFLLAYVCGILWYAGTCYWIYSTMHQYGGLSGLAAFGVLILFCLYLALYHGLFGLVVSCLADSSSFSRNALLLAPPLWVAVELARTRVTGFPWDLLGISQVENIPLSRIASFTGVYGLSFEILVVNAALAAALLVRREKRTALFAAAIGAAIVLQAGSLVSAPEFPADHTATLVQSNIPAIDEREWTREYFQTTVQELTKLSEPSLNGANPSASTRSAGVAGSSRAVGLVVWPESPAPFYDSDRPFRDTLSNVARQTGNWVLAGDVALYDAGKPGQALFNSASLVNPSGEFTARYDKVHLVPFGEYVPFKRVFSFAGGLTQQVGDFSSGNSRQPLQADGAKLGVFICYESIFPDEVRQFAKNGAQIFVNLSNDGWYGDSGAYAQHLKQSRMRAVENARWLLLDTNTGVTASVDPYGRIVASAPRKVRTALQAPYSLSSETTFYTRHGDWFAYLCAIISLAALFMRLPFLKKRKS